jgi:hypothetical protein
MKSLLLCASARCYLDPDLDCDCIHNVQLVYTEIIKIGARDEDVIFFISVSKRLNKLLGSFFVLFSRWRCCCILLLLEERSYQLLNKSPRKRYETHDLMRQLVINGDGLDGLKLEMSSIVKS